MSSLGKMTLAEIRLAAQQRADLVNSQFVTNSEWNSYINLSIYGLYDILIQKFGDDYYVASPNAITTDGTNYLYALPIDFYKMLGVDLKTGAQTNPWTALKPFMFAARNQYKVPAGGRNVQLWYAPRLTELVLDTDTSDGVDGWLEWVINDAAIKARVKEESEISDLAAMRLNIEKRIESAAENRDAGMPQTVTDVYSLSFASFAGPNMSYRITGNNIWLGEFQTVWPFTGGLS